MSPPPFRRVRCGRRDSPGWSAPARDCPGRPIGTRSVSLGDRIACRLRHAVAESSGHSTPPASACVYDLPEVRDALWRRLFEFSGPDWSRVYLCHLVLRQVEWTARHRPDSRDDGRFTGIAAAVLGDCER